LDEEVLACSMGRDGKYIFGGTVSGGIQIFEAGQPNPKKVIAPAFISDEDNSSVTAIKQRNKGPEKLVIATYAAGYVLYWSLETGDCLKTISEGQQIMGFTYHPKEPKFLTFGDDARIRMYDIETGKATMLFENSYRKEDCLGHNSRIFALKFNPKSSYEFITGGWDNTVHFWDTRQPQSNKYIAGPHICGEGLDIDVRGDRVVTCAYQRTNPISLWSYRTAQLIVNVEQASRPMYCGHFIAPKAILVGTSEPAFIQVLNTMSFQFTDTYKLPGRGVYCIDSITTQTEQDTVCNFVAASGSNISQFEYLVTNKISFE